MVLLLAGVFPAMLPKHRFFNIRTNYLVMMLYSFQMITNGKDPHLSFTRLIVLKWEVNVLLTEMNQN